MARRVWCSAHHDKPIAGWRSRAPTVHGTIAYRTPRHVRWRLCLIIAATPASKRNVRTLTSLPEQSYVSGFVLLSRRPGQLVRMRVLVTTETLPTMYSRSKARMKEQPVGLPYCTARVGSSLSIKSSNHLLEHIGHRTKEPNLIRSIRLPSFSNKALCCPTAFEIASMTA